MKKMTKAEVLELLKKKEDYTYQELAHLTGYHPKSLIRLHSNKNDEFLEKKQLEETIIQNYLNSDYRSYQEYYQTLKSNISYSKLCKLLKSGKSNEEIVLIQKMKKKGNYYFEVSDYQTESLLFTMKSLKNDQKSFQQILYHILSEFGAPKQISFSNFFKSIPSNIKTLVGKYQITIVPFKSSYRHIRKVPHLKQVYYKKVAILKEDFYQKSVRKIISENMIQFQNVRYLINTNQKIKKNETVFLYDNHQNMFIKYKNRHYSLIPYQRRTSKKGNSKYQ